ncbi:unnamed protein product [Trichogramma brassicae]|uniref:Uncharacterized protein n=1 Tax=Trichogramma brassicae TaxID=86971 RepID=A0A6H5IQI6_9HYME|nr:unnamed protein product [Trichogramma brassicae]
MSDPSGSVREPIDNSSNQRITRSNAQLDPSKKEEVEFYAFNSGKTLPRTPIRPTAPSLMKLIAPENPIPEGKKKRRSRCKSQDKRRRVKKAIEKKQTSDILTVHLQEYLERKGKPKEREPIDLQAVNPLNFFTDIVRFVPASITRTKLKPSKKKNKTKVTSCSKESELPSTPTSSGDNNVSPVKEIPPVSSTITLDESQEVLNDYILAAEKEAQESPLIIEDDDNYIDLFYEDPIESPYEPESVTGVEVPEIPYTPAISNSSKTDEEVEIPIPESGDPRFVPIPYTKESSIPREWDNSNAPPSSADPPTPKTKGQRTKERKQRQKTPRAQHCAARS